MPSSALALKGSGNWYPVAINCDKSASSNFITKEPLLFLNSDFGIVFTLE